MNHNEIVHGSLKELEDFLEGDNGGHLDNKTLNTIVFRCVKECVHLHRKVRILEKQVEALKETAPQQDDDDDLSL